MKIMKLKLIVSGFVLILFTSIEALAQEKNGKHRKRPSIEKLFADLDENEDGKLSKKEVKGPLKDHFSKIDLNEDGFLTKEEIEKAPKPKRRE